MAPFVNASSFLYKVRISALIATKKSGFTVKQICLYFNLDNHFSFFTVNTLQFNTKSLSIQYSALPKYLDKFLYQKYMRWFKDITWIKRKHKLFFAHYSFQFCFRFSWFAGRWKITIKCINITQSKGISKYYIYTHEWCHQFLQGYDLRIFNLDSSQIIDILFWSRNEIKKKVKFNWY